MRRQLRWWISAGANLLLTVIFVLIARNVPQIYPLFYTRFSLGANRFLAGLFGWIPFPVWEPGLIVLVLGGLALLVRSIVVKRFPRFLARAAVTLSAMLFLFVALWGLNFFAPGIGEEVGLEVGDYSAAQLKQALGYYAEEASRWSTQVERDENGDLVLPPWKELSDGAVASMRSLGERFSRFSDPAPRVKKLLFSDLFAYTGTTGIYVCLTGESGVSSAAHATTIPFTMCHELSHSLCFCREDEANFAGFLACCASDDPLFRYSGSYEAFQYCMSALQEQDPNAAKTYWKLCSPELLHDCSAAAEHYRQYDSGVQTAAQHVNDAYLHTFDQDGVRSYGMVTDHLIAYYLSLSNETEEKNP